MGTRGAGRLDLLHRAFPAGAVVAQSRRKHFARRRVGLQLGNDLRRDLPVPPKTQYIGQQGCGNDVSALQGDRAFDNESECKNGCKDQRNNWPAELNNDCKQRGSFVVRTCVRARTVVMCDMRSKFPQLLWTSM